MEQGRVVANGLGFAYLAAGPPDGQLVLCLHGFPDHAPTYDLLLPELAEAGFRAVAPWLRGYAPTDVPADGSYQTAALALDAIALCDALYPGRPAMLVGSDWGAATAWLAAAHAPGRFERIVGMAVPPTAALAARFLFDVGQLKRSWYIFFFQSPLAEMAVSANDFALIETLWRDWSPGFTPARDFMRALKDTFASPGCTEAALGYYRTMFDPARHDPALAEVQAKAAEGVPVPALYLHGLDDGCLGSELIVPDELRPHFLAGVDVELVGGAGHFLHLEAPSVVNHRIVGFLQGR
jgi:pimeloyl-ACP methyl ester carboxylesterase